MPIYEYSCDQCHSVQEILQKVNEDAPKECPKCHGLNSLKKVVSNSSFHLKGGGWYKDLYSSTKDEKPKKDAKKDSE